MPAGNPPILVNDLLNTHREKGSQLKKSSKSMCIALSSHIHRHSPPQKFVPFLLFLRKKTVYEGCVESSRNHGVLFEYFPTN